MIGPAQPVWKSRHMRSSSAKYWLLYGKSGAMTTIHTGTLEAFNRAIDGEVSRYQIIESISSLTQTDEVEPFHLAALHAAMCFFHNVNDFTGTFQGDPPGTWPPGLAGVDENTALLWAAYAGVVANPLAKARLHHLVHARRVRAGTDHSKAAIEAYLQGADSCWDAADYGRFESIRCLAIALDLAKSTKKTQAAVRVRSVMVDRARELLDDANETWAPGQVSALLTPLCVKPVVAEVAELLDRALVRFATDAFIAVSFLELKRKLAADDGARTAIDREIVTTLINDALVQSGMQRFGRLQEAARVAQAKGLPDLRDKATRELQKLRFEDLGMQKVGGELRLPTEAFDQWAARMDAPATLAEAFWLLARDPSPAGSRDAARQAAEEAQDAGSLAASLPSARLNTNGPVLVTEATIDPQGRLEAQARVFRIQLIGHFLVGALLRLRDRFDPDESELLAMFVAPDAPETRMRKLAHAFQYFWAGEYDAAYALALPRVEGLLRGILHRRGVPVIQHPGPRQRGGMSQLGTLISHMPKVGLDEDWQAFLDLLLTNGDHGLNLRNDELHDLADDDPAPARVALVLLANLYLLGVIHGVVPSVDHTS